MKVDLNELEASLEGLRNLRVEHSKRSPGFLTVTDITNGEQLECIQPLLIRKSTKEDEAFTEAVAAACTNIFALIAELRELREDAARAVEACQRIEEALQGTDFADHGLDSPVWNALELVRDVTADKPALDWLDQQRREAAAEALEEFAYDADGIEELITCNIFDLRSALSARAAALRAGEVGK